jgi:large subunit ribosomal protein L6
MSRIAKKPVIIEEGVTVALAGEIVTVKGPKGELFLKLPKGVKVEINEKDVKIIASANNQDKAGTIRQLIFNMVTGVTKEWSKTLEIQGTGFRAQLNGEKLVMALGFSHQVEVNPPAGITFTVVEQKKITVSGIDKQLVGETSAKLRAVKPPDPYKGKGIRFENEYIKLKPGKQVKVGAAVGGSK